MDLCNGNVYWGNRGNLESNICHPEWSEGYKQWKLYSSPDLHRDQNDIHICQR